MSTPKTDNSNERELAAQMVAKPNNLNQARKRLCEAVTAINSLMDEALEECRAVRNGTPERKLAAISKHEYANRARDAVETAIGTLNKIDGRFKVKGE